MFQTVENQVNFLFEQGDPARTEENLGLLADFRSGLNVGKIRVAEPFGDRWRVNLWVKKGLLLHLTLGLLRQSSSDLPTSFDLDTLPHRRFELDDRVRIPPGSLVRDGSYFAPGVTRMPPAFVDIGTYIDVGSVLDSHITV